MSELCVELFSSNDSPIMFRCKAGSYTDKEETLTIYHMEKHYINYFILQTCSLCFYQVIETLMKVWENSKKPWKQLRLVFPQHFWFLFRMADHYVLSHFSANL